MTRRVVWLAAAVVSSVVCLSAQGRPDFSGTWVVEKAIPPGQGERWEQCTIKQDNKALSLECGTVPPGAPADWFFASVRWTVQFDGTEAHPTHVRSGAPYTKYVSGDGTPLTKLPDAVAKASWDGNTLTVMERGYQLLRTNTDTGIVTNVATKYAFSLDADKRLRIERTVTAEGREPYPARANVYHRKPGSR